MAFTAKNQTNPAIIDATGYAPYIKARAERADAAAGGSKKANKRSQAIRDYWNRQHFLDELSQYSEKHDKDLFRNQWECAADKKSLYSRVRWEVDKVTAKMDEEVERRREKLAELLKAEEIMHLDEVGNVTEDPESKTARMLDRYKELKMHKEMEREKIAKEKKEQQFKRNCDELRRLVSKKIQKETAEEGKQLVREREWEAKERMREDEMYADLWVQDSEAKRDREEKEEEQKKRRDREYGKYVADQMLSNALERQKKIRNVEDDAALMEEQKRLFALEEKYEKELKKRKQAELKEELDKCLRAKLQQKAKEVQDDLLQDLFFMKQIMEDEEEVKKNEKKRALFEEQKNYLQYLKDQIKREADFETEVDKMYQEELEKMWQKREKEWEEEKQKRRQKEKDVMKEVQDQILANAEKGRKVQEMTKLYAQKVREEDVEDRRRAEEKLRLIRERNAEHQKELLNQIKQKEERLRQEKMIRDIELKELQRQREEEEIKIENLLAELSIDNEHPYRGRRREIGCEEN